MKKISIQFDYKGKHYEGHFSEVFRAGVDASVRQTTSGRSQLTTLLAGEDLWHSQIL